MRATGRIRPRWPTASGRTSSDTVLPEAQGHVPACYSLSDPRQVAFAPNTIEFVARLIPASTGRETVARVLASAHEFHSFRRSRPGASRRPAVLTLAEIAAEPFGTFDGAFSPLRGIVGRLGPRLALARLLRFGIRGPRLEGIVPCRAREGDRGQRTAITRSRSAAGGSCRKVHARAFYLAGGYSTAMAG